MGVLTLLKLSELPRLLSLRPLLQGPWVGNVVECSLGIVGMLMSSANNAASLAMINVCCTGEEPC